VAGKDVVQVTDQNFEATVGASQQPVLVDFWATWCAPCKMLKPIVEELAAEYKGRVTLAELDVDANPNTASKFGVLSIPTLILFRGGKPAQANRWLSAKGHAAPEDRRRSVSSAGTGVHGLRWAPRSSKPTFGILGDVEGRIVPVAAPPVFDSDAPLRLNTF